MRDFDVTYDSISKPISDKEILKEIILEVEKILAVELPFSYKEFVLKYNGANLNYLVFESEKEDEGKCYEPEEGINTNVEVQIFYTIENILEALKDPNYTKILPPIKLLPIIYDDTCYYDIAISLDEKYFGQIFSVDHHQDPDPEDENPEYFNLHFMCANFEDFINRLKEELD